MKAVTVTDVTLLPHIVTALLLLKVKPYVRLVCDPGVPPDYYEPACMALRTCTAGILLQPVDSSALKEYTVASIKKRFDKYLHRLGKYCFAVEAGNEINGDWTGKNAWNKTQAAHNTCVQYNIPSAITYYLDGDNPRQIQDWINAYPLLNSEYAFISYYERSAEKKILSLTPYFWLLANKFPGAKLGIGEFGAEGNAPATLDEKITIINNYYRFTPNGDQLTQKLNYVGFGGYWDFVADAMDKTGKIDLNMIEVFNNV